MIDADNLWTASQYINNQLLSRGLLRDGRDIDFTGLGEEEFSTAETSGRIISILNDLIIRRDRDAEQRESLSVALRNLRAENLKYTSDISRLSEKAAEAQRRSDIATASEASLKTQLKSAESTVRGLKDELARTKGLVAQVRTACATEVRRRDRQIESLKKQVGEAGRARGTRTSSGVVSITVTGDVGNEGRRSLTRGGSIEDEDHSLRAETNSFLASLAQNLSEENETLLNVVRQAKDRLCEMSGWNSEGKEDTEVVKPQGWQEMASELGAVMEHLRTILTNPSFVPIEEVMVREEEIDRLKAGWIKMESRWEDAVHLMDGWRKRMAKTGKPIGEEDLKMGLHLSPVRVSNVEETRTGREPGLPAVAEESEEEEEDDELKRSPCPPKGLYRVMADDAEEDEEEDELEEDIYGYSNDESGGLDNNDEGDEGNDGNDGNDNDDDVMEIDEYNAEEPHNHVPEIEETLGGAGDDRRFRESDQPPIPPPHLVPLQNSSSAGNRGPLQSRHRQKPSGSIMQQPNAFTSTEAPKTTSNRAVRPLVTSQKQRSDAAKTAKPEERPLVASTSSLDEALLSNNRVEEHPSSRSGPEVGASSNPVGMRSNPRRMPVRLAPTQANRVSRPQFGSSPSKAAIAAKLAASEKQADAARAKLQALRAAKTAQRPAVASATELSRPPAAARISAVAGSRPRSTSPVKREVAQQEIQKPEKRKRDIRVAKVTSRRRSTLSPFELQGLISGNVE
ncbi:Afadin and alpha-actinin-binding domain-containing protein [Trichoderma evansii]